MLLAIWRINRAMAPPHIRRLLDKAIPPSELAGVESPAEMLQYYEGMGKGLFVDTPSATIREPGFDDVEFHYLRSELRQMPEFDVARDFETGGSAAVIVNRRFYDYCKAHNLKCGFKPVRIDED